jgi:hypothetical protein
MGKRKAFNMRSGLAGFDFFLFSHKKPDGNFKVNFPESQ